ncbi:TPA: dinitrogenase iron-molybdenum cofactor [Candidatus Bipolaricaulota bacterium]|nr:dinitrogenase iron-molybdenum cofactor [Candidatus Bipolaricaulota bacterium]
MKEIFIAATDRGGLEDQVSPVFGRAPSFTVVTVEDGEVVGAEVVQNPYQGAASGAGIQAAQFVVERRPKAVFAGNFGPNAAGILAQAGVELVPASGMPVREAVERYLRGELSSAPGGVAPGFGMGPGMGRGGGRGRGMGRGAGMGRGMGYGQMGWPPYPPGAPIPPGEPAPAEDPNTLRNRISRLEEELSEIKRKLKELGGE